MPNISIATFRGILWWLHGPDAFWVSPFTVFPFFVIETLDPDLYRSDLYFSTSTPVSNDPIGTFRVISGWLRCAGAFLVNRFVFLHLADFYSFKLEPSVSTLMPNESVRTVCVSDGWPGRHRYVYSFSLAVAHALTFYSQQFFLHSIRVDVAAARCAIYAIVTSVSTAIAIASSLSRLALNIWRNRLPSPLEPSELERSPQRLNRHVPRYVYINAFDADPFPSSSRLGHRNFEYIR